VVSKLQYVLYVFQKNKNTTFNIFELLYMYVFSNTAGDVNNPVAAVLPQYIVVNTKLFDISF